MCLAVPGRVLDTESVGENRLGRVEFGGIARQVYLDLVPEAGAGDYVIVHAGIAISKVDAGEAQRTYDLLAQMGALEDQD